MATGTYRPFDTRKFSELTEAQADGLECIECHVSWLHSPVSSTPVGYSTTGSQVFVCTSHLLASQHHTTADRDSEHVNCAGVN